MLYQYLYAYTYKYYSRKYARALFKHGADPLAYEHAYGGYGERDAADDGGGGPYRYAGKRKAYAYRKSVYAGGNSHNEQVLRSERITNVLFIVAALSNFYYHSYAYERQQPERHPVIYLFNICAYAVAQEPTYNRHKELEEAKEESKLNYVFPVWRIGHYTAGHRNRKRIHRKCYRNK